jgi:hypothetical protein
MRIFRELKLYYADYCCEDCRTFSVGGRCPRCGKVFPDQGHIVLMDINGKTSDLDDILIKSEKIKTFVSSQIKKSKGDLK